MRSTSNTTSQHFLTRTVQQPQAHHRVQMSSAAPPQQPGFRSRSYDEEETLTQQRSLQRPSSYGNLPAQEFLFKNIQGQSNRPNSQPAPRLVRKLEPVVQRACGQPLKLEIEVNEMPECHIRWLKDGKQVQNTPQTRVNSSFGVHTLIIPRVTPEDAGVYKVVVETPVGNLETSCELIAEGAELCMFFFLFRCCFCC